MSKYIWSGKENGVYVWHIWRRKCTEGGGKKYYVAHELIHYWQAENFGSLVLLNDEQWLIEGMAYALSNDPRNELYEPFESYCQKFTEWHRLNEVNPLEKSVGEVLK